MIIKRLLITGIAISILFSLVTMVSTFSIPKSELMSIHALEEGFPTIDQLKSNSQLIIKGKVVKSDQTKKVNMKKAPEVQDVQQGKVDEDFVLYTDKIVKVDKVYKGTGVKPDDQIRVRTLEGEVDGLVQKAEFGVKDGKSYTLFLIPSSFPVNDGAYESLGGRQGIFEMNKDGKAINDKYKDVNTLEILEKKLQ